MVRIREPTPGRPSRRWILAKSPVTWSTPAISLEHGREGFEIPAIERLMAFLGRDLSWFGGS